MFVYSSHLVLERDSLVVKVFLFQKILQRYSFLLALLPKDLPWVVSENSGKCQGTFSIPMGGNQAVQYKTDMSSPPFLVAESSNCILNKY